jgi:hypothetical protein
MRLGLTLTTVEVEIEEVEIDAAEGVTNKAIRYISILSSCFRMKNCKTNLVICFQKLDVASHIFSEIETNWKRKD